MAKADDTLKASVAAFARTVQAAREAAKGPQTPPPTPPAPAGAAVPSPTTGR